MWLACAACTDSLGPRFASVRIRTTTAVPAQASAIHATDWMSLPANLPTDSTTSGLRKLPRKTQRPSNEVAANTEAQQALVALHGMWQQLVKFRAMQINRSTACAAY